MTSAARKKKSTDSRKWELPSPNFLDGLKNAVDQLPNLPGFDRHSIFFSYLYCECFRGKAVKLTIPAEQKHLLRECMRIRDQYFPNVSAVDKADDVDLLNLVKKRVNERLYDQENSMTEMNYEEMEERGIERGLSLEENLYNTDAPRHLLNPNEISLGDEILDTSREEINGYLNGQEYEEDVGDMMDYLVAPPGAHQFDVMMDEVRRDSNQNENIPAPVVSQEPPLVENVPRNFAPSKKVCPDQENMDVDAGDSISSYGPLTPSPSVSECDDFVPNADVQEQTEQKQKRSFLFLQISQPPAHPNPSYSDTPAPKRARTEPKENNETPFPTNRGAQTAEKSSISGNDNPISPSPEDPLDVDVVKVEKEPIVIRVACSPCGSSQSSSGVNDTSLSKQLRVAMEECFYTLSAEPRDEREKLAMSVGDEIETRLRATFDTLGGKFPLEKGGFAKRLMALFDIHDKYFTQKLRVTKCRACGEAFGENALAKHVMSKGHLRHVSILSKMKRHHTMYRDADFDCGEEKEKEVIDFLENFSSPPVYSFHKKNFGLAFLKFAELVEDYQKSVDRGRVDAAKTTEDSAKKKM